MIIEFRCKMCGRLATRDVKAYKKGMNVCAHCVPNSGCRSSDPHPSSGGESVNIHVDRLGACL